MIYTRKMLANFYGISYNTFKRRLSEIDGLEISKRQRALTPLQVEIIFKKLGTPQFTPKSIHKYS